MTITEFLLARIAEDEGVARDLLTDLEGEVSEDWANQSDEHGPMTPDRLLSSQMWARYDGQSKRRSFARGQQIATLASPARVLAECAAKRGIIVTVDGWAHDFNDGDSWYSCGLAVDNFEFADDKTPGSGCSNEDNRGECQCGLERRQLLILAPMAAVYASHPDYQSAWLV